MTCLNVFISATDTCTNDTEKVLSPQLAVVLGLNTLTFMFTQVMW